MKQADVVILGAGAAGLFCAGSLVGSGREVVVLDHARRVGEKIRISGGGRCNFTNLATHHDRFLSDTRRFCASALSGFPPESFVAMVDAEGIAWHEKTDGQLFCDGKAVQIIDMLIRRAGPARIHTEVGVNGVEHGTGGFVVQTGDGPLRAKAVVVATGGRSIPKMGATGVGYDIARMTGHRLVEQRPGLVPLTFAEQDLHLCRPLAGLAVNATVRAGTAIFRDGLLFTHRGLSGPAILQASSFWTPGEAICVNLAPDTDVAAHLLQSRGNHGGQGVVAALARVLPERLAASIAEDQGIAGKKLAELSDARIRTLAERVNAWRLKPVGSEGYRTAEVTVGGVDCRDLDGRTMMSRIVPGLYFIGEVVDVTGWLGGYNFQWAWASGHAAARAILSD